MLFGYEKEQLEAIGAIHTASEIAQQPDMWKKTLKLVGGQAGKIRAFIGKVTSSPDYDVVFVGAGTSEYVGRTVLDCLNEQLDFHAHACGTTDIVADPERYLSASKPTLMVSFARSGNSPESVTVVKLANEICRNIHHLIITCNHDGALAKMGQQDPNMYTILLPSETNDLGFAMTSSFTCMLLAALLAFTPANFQRESRLGSVADAGQRFIADGWRDIADVVAGFDFDRVVYLGTGPLKGIAQESALKMLELNAGRIATFFDSPLGLRHGPKSVIDARTLTVIFVSDEPYTRQYEIDLVKELRQQGAGKLLVLYNHEGEDVRGLGDYSCAFQCTEHLLVADQYAFLCIMSTQLLALLRSIKSGIVPDNPFPKGELSRVVRQFKIYPYPENAVNAK